MEIAWLDQPDCHQISLVGGKVANLSRLAADYPVPPGFCLTTSAFAQWTLTKDNTSPTVPPSIYELLADAYQSLAKTCQVAEPKVAVRSSATDEDGQKASFAGQYETYLNQVGIDAVAKAVARCWASVYSGCVQEYRRQQELLTETPQIAVLVQQMVAADISVVVFSANPVSNNREEIIINASWGLGESIVGGTVTPDTYVVCKSDLTLIRQEIADKQQMTIMTNNGTKEVTVPRLLSKQPALTKAQAIELAKLALTLEEKMGGLVDIECAFQADKLYLLQCRPITTLT
ncbi:MAG: hypothetical protein DRR19_05585 [Candidatus Parabeggiatoa sp. nov. 1]|nr:MAG: hypothetical protein DRR19_05585 [Gammaproteobacteria bacterium]